MFILTNLHVDEDFQFDIKEVDNCKYIEKSFGDILIVGREKESPCNFYVVENIENNICNKNNIQEAKLMEIEIIYEKGVQQDEFSAIELVKSFGSKKSVDRLKNIEIHGYLKKTTMKVENRNQIIPTVNKEATSPLEYFLLGDMFPDSIINYFNTINIEDVELQEESKAFTMKPKVKFLLADALIKILKFKYVTEDILDNTIYSPIAVLFKDDIEQRRLPKIVKDKLIVLLYILILQLEGGQVRLSSLPLFNIKSESILEYLKLIGCTYNQKTDIVRLSNKPEEIVTRYL